MTSLVLAALVFAGIHLFVSGTRLRDRLVANLGENGYRALFSVVSAAVLAWLIWSYGQVRVPQLTPLVEIRALAAVLMFLAFVLIVLGLMTPGPTVVGGEKLLQRENAARGVHRITRHPFLWGVGLWALTHLLFNADLPNLLFFGTFAVVAVAGTFSIDAKRARLYGEAWSRYASRTSNLPFAAIVQGRNALAPGEIGVVKIAIAALAYGAFAYFHARFFGMPPL